MMTKERIAELRATTRFCGVKEWDEVMDEVERLQKALNEILTGRVQIKVTRRKK